MDLLQVSEKIKIKNLRVKKEVSEETNEPTGWLRHWDNEQRILVSLHQEVWDVLKDKEKRQFADFGVQTEEKVSKAGNPYASHRIVMYTTEQVSLLD